MAKMQLMEFMGRARDLEVLCYKQQQVVQGLERLLKQNKQKCYDEQKYLLKYKAKKSQAKEPDRAKLFWAGFMGIPAILAVLVCFAGLLTDQDDEPLRFLFMMCFFWGYVLPVFWPCI